MSLSHFFDILHDYVFASHFPNKFVSVEFFAYFAFFGRITSIRLYINMYTFFCWPAWWGRGRQGRLKRKRYVKKNYVMIKFFNVQQMRGVCISNVYGTETCILYVSMYIKSISNLCFIHIWHTYSIHRYVYQMRRGYISNVHGTAICTHRDIW